MGTTKKYNKRKEELFDHIAKVINRDGYENITVRGLCSELNISIGTFYHYFSEKGDLIAALFDDIDNYYINEVTSKFTDDELNNLKIFSISYGEYVLKNGLEVGRCISIAPLNNTSAEYLHNKRGISKVLEGIFNRGIEKGQFDIPRDIQSFSSMLMTLLRGFCAEWVRHNGNYDINAELDNFITLFIKTIK